MIVILIQQVLGLLIFSRKRETDINYHGYIYFQDTEVDGYSSIVNIGERDEIPMLKY